MQNLKYINYNTFDTQPIEIKEETGHYLLKGD